MSELIKAEIAALRIKYINEVSEILDDIFPAIEKTIVASISKGIMKIKELAVYNYGDENHFKMQIFHDELIIRIGNDAKLNADSSKSSKNHYVFDLELDIPRCEYRPKRTY